MLICCLFREDSQVRSSFSQIALVVRGCGTTQIWEDSSRSTWSLRQSFNCSLIWQRGTWSNKCFLSYIELNINFPAKLDEQTIPLQEVQAANKTIQELAIDCADLTKIRKHYGAPSLFRVVLMGPRGSGCRSLAKHISATFDLVHGNSIINN